MSIASEHSPRLAYAPTPRPIACERCGEDHWRCSGHNSAGMPCRAWPVKGVDVCITHGGAAGQVRNAAERRVQQMELHASMITLGLPISDEECNEYALIREAIRGAAGHIRWLEIAVGELERSQLTWSVQSEEVTTLEEDTVGGAAGTGSKKGRTVLTKKGAVLHLYYTMLTQERRDLVTFCATAIRLGLAERELRVTEELAAAFIDAQREALTDPRAGLTPGQIDLIWRLTEEQFRKPRPMLDAGAVPAMSVRTVPAGSTV